MNDSKPDAWALRAAHAIRDAYITDEGFPDEWARTIQHAHEAAGWEELREAAQRYLTTPLDEVFTNKDKLRAALARVEENR